VVVTDADDPHTDLRLVAPSQALVDAYLSYAAEWRGGGYARFDLGPEDFDAFLAKLERDADEATLPAGRVPSATRWLLHGEAGAERIVATSRLRFWVTPALENEGGHIGYDVCPSQRGRGYGHAILRHTLVEARRRGIDRVVVTCDEDNLASRRIIEAAGGELLGRGLSEDTGVPVRRYAIE